MRVLSIGSAKGGVGKTTSTLYIGTRAAAYLGGTRANPVVGLVDRDESRNLTRLVSIDPTLLRPGVVLLPDEELPPKSMGLQLVIVDTPPGLTALNALREADLIVVPVTPATQSILNLTQYLRNLAKQRVVMNPGMRLLALLPTMVRNTTLHRHRLADIAEIAAEQRPPLLVLPPIPLRASIESYDLDAPEYTQPAKELLTNAEIIRHGAPARP